MAETTHASVTNNNRTISWEICTLFIIVVRMHAIGKKKISAYHLFLKCLKCWVLVGKLSAYHTFIQVSKVSRIRRV